MQALVLCTVRRHLFIFLFICLFLFSFLCLQCKLRCIVRHVHSYQEYDQCLEETRICNRQVDCEDKSDEKHEACVIMGREDREVTSYAIIHYRPQLSCEGYVFTPVCLSTEGGGDVCLSACWDTITPQE